MDHKRGDALLDIGAIRLDAATHKTLGRLYGPACTVGPDGCADVDLICAPQPKATNPPDLEVAMKRIGINIVLGLALSLVWVSIPASAATTAPAVPAWATAAAATLVGSNAPSLSDPYPQVLTVDQMAQRVYASALATRDFYALGHRPIDPATGNFLDANGHPTGLNAGAPPGPTTSGAATPLTGCSGVNDPNATCHAYSGTANNSAIDGNTCYTNPTGYDGCMGETNQYPQFTYYCGPGSSRVMASNWYAPPIYNLGASPPNSTSKGYAYYEHTNPSDPNTATITSNMPTPINNDIINHVGINVGVTYGQSGSQNSFCPALVTTSARAMR